MDFIEGFLIIGAVHLLAAMSPGPDFILVTKESLQNGKKAGFLCAFGITLGLSVHIVYSALGLATVIANSITFLYIIKILGGVYLIYLGMSALVGAKNSQMANNTTSNNRKSDFQTIKTGFLCNVFNPKAPLYFVSLFTVVINPNLPLYQLLIYGVWIMVIQFVWFGFIAYVLSSPKVQKRFLKFNKWISYVLGAAMIGLGVKVLAAKT